MKKIIIPAFAIVSLILISCGGEAKKENAVAVEYTCPMHPEVISKEPGKCPKCGMDLVVKEKHETHEHADSTGHNHAH